ncbi:MAG: Smr/MutS family protein [Clostridia bacterium]|nr:Smr/MutS family protein [Clostridia bacterium]
MSLNIEKLELNIILEKTSAHASSKLGKEKVLSSEIFNSLAPAEANLLLTEQAVKLIDLKRHRGVESFPDISEILNKANAGATLTFSELLNVSQLLRSARIASNSFSFSDFSCDELSDIALRIFYDAELEKDINYKIISESEMSDNASDKLKDIRIKLKNAQARLVNKLNSYTKSNQYSKYLQDNLYTVRSGRYVLPVKNECRSEVKGLLHDLSGTGSTAFIEPFEVVEMNNEIIKLRTDESIEIERILSILTEAVSLISERLAFSQDSLAFLDSIFAKARYSIEIDGIKPELSFAGEINLLSARHPLLSRDTVVPIDISLTDDKPILLISGPNTGGKTVSIKTVGLFSLMLSAGLLVPCKCGSKMAIFDEIFCDIGDAQNISENLSTFSSHINNLIAITTSFTNESLILLDEIGSSTNPEEGAALAIGVIDYIKQTKAKAIITTHYSQLKNYAMQSDKIMNAGMQFDPVTLKPTFKLILGYPGLSNAIDTADYLGLNSEITTKARKVLGENGAGNYEKLLVKAGEIKNKAEEELALADDKLKAADAKLKDIEAKERKINETLDRINANAKIEARKIASRIADKANEIFEEVKQTLKEADEKALLLAKKDLKRLESLADGELEARESVLCTDLEEKDIYKGAEVVIKSFGGIGVIDSFNLKKKTADVIYNGKSINIKLKDLAKSIMPSKEESSKEKYEFQVESPVELSREVNVIGESVDDAVAILEPIIINAARLNLKNLRIVHGKGTGVLGKGIQNYLKKCSNVKSFRYGKYGEGDNGVTLVEFK